jgi:hypothetical protein
MMAPLFRVLVACNLFLCLAYQVFKNACPLKSSFEIFLPSISRSKKLSQVGSDQHIAWPALKVAGLARVQAER